MFDLQVTNSDGEVLSINRKEFKKQVEQLDQQQLQDAQYMAKELKPALKVIDDTVKKRLDEGQQFKNISYKETQRASVDQSEATKQAFVNKYGWDAVQVKTPTQLKKIYGEKIEQDLETVMVYSNINKLSYD
ncbi:hypothetical protein [Eupransor demetentiae]|uniref:Uncharacterized protein n=1 Tax=Eupransor demetentiae TaxID=3109584 RepID=A0ABP0EQW5_9LACO|nr:hypothetical protein R54876_GBNLAHCA_00711 [Lactobacillaceae bacterium LMG 33000]